MPQGSLSISKALSNVSIQYKNGQYIFNQFLKDVPVTQDSGKYFVYNKNMRLEETERANRSPANMATFGVSTSIYLVREHALKDVISDADRDNSDVPGSLDVDTVEFLTDKILMRQEKIVSDLIFTTTTWSQNGTLTTASSWNYNTTTSAPIQSVLSATAVILAQSGKMANTMIFNNAVLNALKENNNVYNRLAYTRDQILTKDILASLFDMDNIYVGTAQYETNQEGLDSTQTAIWPSDAFIGYFEQFPGLKKATAINMFRVKKKGMPYRVKKWWDEDIEGTYIEVQTKGIPKAIATLTGYLYKTVALI